MSNIAVAFIGTGWMGSVQLAYLAKKPNVEIKYVVNPNTQRAEQLVADLGIAGARVTDSFDETLDDPNVDTSWIVSPNSFHGDQAIRSLESDRHVFCEKPPSTTYKEYLRELELDREKPACRTFVDYILYFNPMERWVIDSARGGEFGKVHQIQVNYRHPVNISGEKRWKLSREIMGDALGMGVNHAISMIVLAMQHQARPVSVYAVSHNTGVRGFEADPVWTVVIRFDDGATGICLGNIDVGNGYDLYHNIAGDRGGFVFDSLLNQEAKVRYWKENSSSGKWVYPLDAERCRLEGTEALAWPSDFMLPDSGNVIDHQTGDAAEHFLQCIFTESDSPLSFTGSSAITEIGWAAQVSALTGREVLLPLDHDLALSVLQTGRTGTPS